MYPFHRVRIRSYEKGLRFCQGDFHSLLQPGTHWIFDPLLRNRVRISSTRNPWLEYTDLDLVVRAGVLDKEAQVIDLASNQRALVRVDGRFEMVLGPGLHALWTGFRKVEVELHDTDQLLFGHHDLAAILDTPGADLYLERIVVAEGFQALLYQGGELKQLLSPGLHAYWKQTGMVQLFMVDRRRQQLDVKGQEIITADKVSLRLNVTVSYRVTDLRRAVDEVENYQQTLYREAQLALREVVGGRDLDLLLSDKEAVAAELTSRLEARAEGLGLGDLKLGICDVVLPGEMKELMNRVTEAKKAAEAALITRREETAAMRSQANTAKLLENNPTLMRLRELEVLSGIAEKGKLNIILGEKGLTDRVVNLL